MRIIMCYVYTLWKISTCNKIVEVKIYFSCDVKHLLYVSICNVCKLHYHYRYVGETSEFRNRRNIVSGSFAKLSPLLYLPEI